MTIFSFHDVVSETAPFSIVRFGMSKYFRVILEMESADGRTEHPHANNEGNVSRIHSFITNIFTCC